MFAIALLVLGTLCTALVWLVGLVKLICTFNDNALIAIQYGGPLLLLVSGIVAFKGDPTTAGNLLYWTAVLVVGVLPVLWAIGDALVFRKNWLLLPIVASIISFATGVVAVLG